MKIYIEALGRGRGADVLEMNVQVVSFFPLVFIGGGIVTCIITHPQGIKQLLVFLLTKIHGTLQLKTLALPSLVCPWYVKEQHLGAC